MARWWMLAYGSLALTGTAAAPLGPLPSITDLRPITLHGRVNRVPGFLPGGGTAAIVQGWVDNGNAHGHYTWMVLAGGRPVGLSVFEGGSDDPSSGGDTIGASPFDGERVTGDVRFATARVDGKPLALAIKGALDWPPSGIVADHATATIRWWKLMHRADPGIEPPNIFERLGTVHTARRYCNMNLALRDVAGIPLPRDFTGANPVDGCFASD